MTQADPPPFAAVLQHYRQQAGLTQEELAERAQLSARGISDLERGVRQQPRPHTVRLLAAALHLSPDDRAVFERAAHPGSSLAASAPPRTRLPLLPTPPTPLLGRAHDVARVRALLARADVRLMTLVGTGGVGKTRVALQVAAGLHTAFRDGVVFVALAAIRDSDLVLPTIAHTLGVTLSGSAPLEERLNDYLRDRQLLLVVDNLEHLLPAAPRIAALVANAPQVQVLLTSRARLHLQGEHDVPLPPLDLPDPQQRARWSAVTLAQIPAVALFVARAQAVNPSFVLTDANAVAVADVCARLDGLPLAIELAASRITLLPPLALLARLGDQRTLLQGGAVDAEPKQQTLQATLDWSYNLLTAAEQVLFARLAVFVGGWTLAAAEAICQGPDDQPLDVLQGLHALLDHHLLTATDGGDGEPRLGMLETIREYARERLLGSGEADTMQRAHAAYYLALAEQAEGELTGPQQAHWLARLEQEHDNLRAVLRWAEERGDGETTLRMGSAVWRFWGMHGYAHEGREWLQAALAQETVQPAALQAKALTAAGMLALYQNQYATARPLFEDSLALAHAIKDPTGVATALLNLGRIAMEQGELPRATALLEESLTLYQAVNHTYGMADTLNVLACVVQNQGNLARADTLFEESLALHQQSGNLRGCAFVLNNLGILAQEQGDYARATNILAECLMLDRQLGDIWGSAMTLNNLGMAHHEQGNDVQAVALYEESLALSRQLHDKLSIARTLDNLGEVALGQGDLTRAVNLFTESVALLRELEHLRSNALHLNHLARAVHLQGNDAKATETFKESLALAWNLRDMLCIAVNFEGMAAMAAAQGQPARVVQLLGAAAGLREASGTPLRPSERAPYEQLLTTVRTQLDTTTFATLWAEGQRMSLEEAVAYAQDVPSPLVVGAR